MLSPHTSASFYAESLEGNFELVNDGDRRKAMKEDIARLVESGESWLLPHRIGILQGTSMVSVGGSGRARRPLDAQMKGTFISVEESPYKQNKPYEVQTGLWRVPGERCLFYGSIGITGANGRIDRDNGDLIVARTSNWRRVEIFIFRGLAGVDKQLDYLPEVVGFIKGL